MTWGMVAVAGAGLVGGMMSSNAAGDAADTQAAATQASNDRLERQYNTTRSDLQPWRQSGQSANNKLMQLLGIGSGPSAGPAGVDQNDPVWQSLMADYQQKHRAQFGTDPTTDFNAGPDERALYDHMASIYQQTKANMGQPVQQDQSYGSLLKPFTGADLQNEPGYQFGLAQGQQGIDRRAQAGGNYFSGNALKAAARFGNDYGTTKFDNAFNRDASTKRQAYDFLSGQSSSGQNAATMTANAGTQMAGQVGANTTAMGNAMGASQIAQGNALGGAVTGAANGYQQNQLMNAILGGNSGFGGGRTASTGGFGTGAGYGNQDYGQYF